MAFTTPVSGNVVSFPSRRRPFCAPSRPRILRPCELPESSPPGDWMEVPKSPCVLQSTTDRISHKAQVSTSLRRRCSYAMRCFSTTWSGTILPVKDGAIVAVDDIDAKTAALYMYREIRQDWKRRGGIFTKFNSHTWTNPAYLSRKVLE